MKVKASTHAAIRSIERLKLDVNVLLSNFNLIRYKYRYVDRVGVHHVYDTKFGIEIVGKIYYNEFFIFTIINMDLSEFCKRRRWYGLCGDEWSIPL